MLRIREAKLRVVAERVGLRRLHVLAPHLRTLILDGSAMQSLRDLGIGLTKLKVGIYTYLLEIHIIVIRNNKMTSRYYNGSICSVSALTAVV